MGRGEFYKGVLDETPELLEVAIDVGIVRGKHGLSDGVGGLLRRGFVIEVSLKGFGFVGVAAVFFGLFFEPPTWPFWILVRVII